MGNKAISVTNDDLDRFRKLMRFFYVENLKDIMVKYSEKIDIIKASLHDLDIHFTLEEPFIAAQIGMSQHEAEQGTLVVSDKLFETYKSFALFDIKGSYRPIISSEDDKLILETALTIQKRLVEVLDAAVEMHSPEEQIVFPPTTQKQFLN